jgi:hypothetical protein
MDDWSPTPSRNADSEPAPNPRHDLTPTTTPDQLQPTRTRATNGAGEPLPAAARTAEPDSNPETPIPTLAIPMSTTTNQPNDPDLQPPLDTNVPFMDDNSNRHKEARPPRRRAESSRYT